MNYPIEFPTFPIIIYICPTPGCGNFIGSPTFREDKTDLTSPQTKRGLAGSEQTHPRKDCPDCRDANRGIVKRIPYIVTTVTPLQIALKHAKSSSNDNQAVQIRSESPPIEPRREMQEPARPFLHGRSAMRRINQLRRWSSKTRDGVRLRRRDKGMEDNN